MIFSKNARYFSHFILTGEHKEFPGVFQIFANGNVQRIEIRWNNMLPSLWLS